MPTTTDAAALVERIQQRLAPLEHTLQQAYWDAAADARPETSAAKASAEEAYLGALADPALLAEIEAALAGAAGGGEPLTARALAKARLELLANQIPERNRRKFLTLLGIPLQPATPARGLVTFTNERGPLRTITLIGPSTFCVAAKINALATTPVPHASVSSSTPRS